MLCLHVLSLDLISLRLLERGHKHLLFLVLLIHVAIVSSYGHPSNVGEFCVTPLEIGLQWIFESLKWYEIVRIKLCPSKRYVEVLTLILSETGLLQI